jgi:hypothetical protein
VCRVLENLNKQDPILSEFLEFMESHSLNPGRPIDSETMKAFPASSDFKAKLTRFTNKLFYEYSWAIVPTRYLKKPEIRDRYGRVGIEFQSEHGHSRSNRLPWPEQSTDPTSEGDVSSAVGQKR